MVNIDIDNITLDQIPLAENEHFEFKSSKIKNDIESLKNKLGKAASGFANSGGGYFIVGVDENTGNADGGIPLLIKGRDPIRSWVDKMIHQLVEPTPVYTVKLIDDPSGRGIIDQGSVVLIVYVYESYNGPHMMAGSYYIRAGEHTVLARHFIVEAIRAKRFNAKPKLTHVFRLKPGYEQVLQLGIVAITTAAAVNIVLSLDPLPRMLQKRAQDFPIRLPLIDQSNPFFFDVSLYHDSAESFGNDIKLNIEYDDLLQNQYSQELIIGVESTPPILIGNPSKEIIRALNSIEKALLKLNSR